MAKRHIGLLGAVLATTAVSAAIRTAHAAPGLFFSEYVEGSGYNKALEIYNAGEQRADLAQYRIAIYFNGATQAAAMIPLSGVLAPGDTFVFADARADSAVLDAADQTYGQGLFNGNDAVALLDNGAPIDVIGQIGADPGAAWGSGATNTRDHTLRRKLALTMGRTDGSTPFEPASEWNGFPGNSFADLGTVGGEPPPMMAFGACGDPATPIHAIQGTGENSPLLDDRRIVEATVTANFPGDRGLGGFFLQQPAIEADADPRTSEGLFVYTAAANPAARVGDRVRVRGQIAEYSGQTELRGVDRVQACGRGAPIAPTLLTLPFASQKAPERVEGMRVTLSQRLTVSGNYDLGRYGELTLSAGGRLLTPTNVVAPGAQARALAAVNARNRLVLDDGESRQNPDPVVYPAPRLSAFNTVRTGDTVTGIEGVLGYGFGDWRIEATRRPTFDPVNPRPDPNSLPAGGNLRVASFNVLNFFNGDGMGGGFPTARGADTPEELARQRAKIVAAIGDLDADVIGLMEIENDGYGPNSAIQALVDGLNEAAPAGTRYAFVDAGGDRLGGDAIAVGLLYDSARVTPVGAAASLTTPPFDYGNRPPLAQTFATADGPQVTVVVNHLKSKGSCPEEAGPNMDQGDGQSCWNALRTRAAEAEARWLASGPTVAAAHNTLVIGDLNAYLREDPIRAFERAGYVSLLQRNPIADRATYVFDAESGALDHALASPALVGDVIAARSFAINADEPNVLDYNEEYKTAGQIANYYNPGPYRASDHDPVVIELRLAPATTH